jgi:hypothetical protein
VIGHAERETRVLVAILRNPVVERDHLRAMPGMARHHQDTIDDADIGQANAGSGRLDKQGNGRKRDRKQDGRNAHSESPNTLMALKGARDDRSARRSNCGAGCGSHCGRAK